MESQNAKRARAGAVAVATYTGYTEARAPITAEGQASLARYVAEDWAKAQGTTGPAELAETDVIDAAALISHLAADVLHYLDGALDAKVLTTAALAIYQRDIGEYTGIIAVLTEHAQEVVNAVKFVAALCHAAVTFDADPDDMLKHALEDFRHYAEEERFQHVKQTRAARLSV